MAPSRGAERWLDERVGRARRGVPDGRPGPAVPPTNDDSKRRHRRDDPAIRGRHRRERGHRRTGRSTLMSRRSVRGWLLSGTASSRPSPPPDGSRSGPRASTRRHGRWRSPRRGGALLGTCDFVSRWILVQPAQTPWVVVQAVVPPGRSSVRVAPVRSTPPQRRRRTIGQPEPSSCRASRWSTTATWLAPPPRERPGGMRRAPHRPGRHPAQTTSYRLRLSRMRTPQGRRTGQRPVQRRVLGRRASGRRGLSPAPTTHRRRRPRFIRGAARPARRIVHGKVTANEHALTEVVRVRIDVEPGG